MRELYNTARRGPRLTQRYGQNMNYVGIGEHLTVYNATPPLWLRVNGKIRRVSIGRVEHLQDWAHSRIMCFEQSSASATEYRLIPEAPVFYGEDPAVTIIGGKIVLSTVNVSAVSRNKHLFQTEIRRANDLMDLWGVWRRIPGKDNRFTPIDDNTRVAVMTRPQGGKAGAGKMAYMELDSLEALSAHKLSEARIIEFPEAEATWVGPNELHDLSRKNRIGILAHGAFECGGTKTYFSFFAWMDRESLEIVDVQVLALREDFPMSESKLPGLMNVAFGTGLVIPSGPRRECARLYAGIGDCVQAYVPIASQKITGLYSD